MSAVSVIQREGFTEVWPVDEAEIPEAYTVLRDAWSEVAAFEALGLNPNVRRIIEWEPAPQLVVVNDVPGLGFRIERLWAFLAVGGDDDEGVIAAPLGGTLMPLVAADPARLEQLRPMARFAAEATGRKVVLARFDQRTDEETFGG